MSEQEFVQTVLVDLRGHLYLTLVPKQSPEIKKVRLDGTNYFLSAITNDGSDGTGLFGFYILSETTQDFNAKPELPPEEQQAPSDAVNDVVKESVDQ